MKGFKVYPIDTTTGLLAATGRRDLYKIYLLTGSWQWQYADGETEWHGTYLCCGNPREMGRSQKEAARQTGYGCLFTEEFIQECRQTESQLPWALGAGQQPRVFSLSNEQATYFTSLFQKMLAEQQSAYRFKDELLRNYLHLVLHEVMRLRQPAPKYRFRYYCRLPGAAGELAAGWGSRRV